MVVPSLPGFGFSTPLRQAGINYWKTAELLPQAIAWERGVLCHITVHMLDPQSLAFAMHDSPVDTSPRPKNHSR